MGATVKSKRRFRLHESVTPKGWKTYVDVKKILADSKVYPEGVKMYEDMIRRGEDIGAITLIKHPKEDLYAVLDGHHRFHAYSKMGIERTNCIVVPDPVGFLFTLTKDGMLQPTEEFTKHVRVPFKKLESFLYDFLNRPDELLKQKLLSRPIDRERKMQ